MKEIEPAPSLTELALQTKKVLLLGVGGGGDVIQTIPVANYLRLLGVQDIFTGGVNCAWWTSTGEPLSNDRGSCILGPTIYDLDELHPSTRWTKGIVGVEQSSAVGGRRPAEAILADVLPGKPFIADLRSGAAGLRDALQHVIDQYQIGLVIGVDIGSDTFHDGNEVMKARTSLVDFISLAALIQLNTPVLYGLSGYGADGEMQLEELDERVGRIMRAGGYRDAIGLTQRDVREMLHACELYPDPVEPVAPRAAKGELGLRLVNTHGPWGTVIRVTPLAATMLFFDPRTMVNTVSTGVNALRTTTSLAEAERIYRYELDEYPETQLEPVIQFFRG